MLTLSPGDLPDISYKFKAELMFWQNIQSFSTWLTNEHQNQMFIWHFKEVANTLSTQLAKVTEINVFKYTLGKKKWERICLLLSNDKMNFSEFPLFLKSRAKHYIWQYMRKKERPLVLFPVVRSQSKTEDMHGKLLNILLSDDLGNTWKLPLVRTEV